MTKIESFEFNGQFVEFELGSSNIMVNATEMAKIYDRQVVAFMRNEETKRFVEECLKSENSHFLGIKNEQDLCVSKQRSGTWMHRILALKFAAWLDPAFELWVYCTIDKLLFGNVRKVLQEKAATELRRQELHTKLMMTNTEYQEMIDLQSKASEMGKRIKKNMIHQLLIFKEEDLN